MKCCPSDDDDDDDQFGYQWGYRRYNMDINLNSIFKCMVIMTPSVASQSWHRSAIKSLSGVPTLAWRKERG
ncbi:hypothetical protein OPV22_021275 [Ensete ventricosum]|uniref:Uncharacterized protein n=1 Tax=Ensete ventricosum TaxID=4639 RepID=A0AAV8QM25_ENSVE|nr:hypothetical protein OPV22_021275 [Ensete ventricosum]